MYVQCISGLKVTPSVGERLTMTLQKSMNDRALED